MENNLSQLQKLKDIHLSSDEKAFLRAHAVHVMHTPLPSRQKQMVSMFQKGMYHGLRIALSSFIFVIFASGTVSAVADNALPGDPLYAFKLNVNEQVKTFFLKTPEEKVAYQQKRIETRVKEIKTLADSKTLTKEKQATVQKALDAHLNDLSKDLENLPTDAALSATATIEQRLIENKEVLSTTSDENTAKTAALEAVDGTLKKVSAQEIKIVSKELDAIATDLTTTPPTPFEP